jgi:NitT/TauT family transport system permease protein
MSPATAARLRNVAAPAAIFVVFVALWQASVFNDLLGLETFAVPLPDHIVEAASDNASSLWGAFRQTFAAVLLGYALGNGLGFLLALLLLALPHGAARRTGAVFTAFQALPIIAIAPLVALWIPDSLWFKAVVVTIMVFPSMLVYAWRGMSGVPPEALELMASYRASTRQVLTGLRIPAAVPQVFTALKYTTVLALIGVVVCEILKSHDGLGYEIHDALQKFSTPLAWSAVAVLALVGIATYSLLVLLERVLFPWAARRG